jgi:uncharacterized SAM-binding protein YcdF (DUF218 family)
MKEDPRKKRGFFYWLNHQLPRWISAGKIWPNHHGLKNQGNIRRLIPKFLSLLGIFFLVAIVILIGLFGSWWLLLDPPLLRESANRPIDSILVLGGSISREIYVAELAKKFPQIPILISRGSADPCIWLIFQQAAAPIDQVWLQNCATSTFENYYFALPLLQQWNVHHLKIITSASHLPRAKWLAQIILGSHGIWTEFDVVKEEGIPGNRETWLKTSLDVLRSLVWARVSQYYNPECSHLKHLPMVDFLAWEKRGFKCEHKVKLYRKN